MRIRNNEPISFEEAKSLLASRNGSANLQRKIDSLEWLLNQHINHIPFKSNQSILNESALVECAECGEQTQLTKRMDLCQDCYYAISGYMEV